MTQRAHRKSRRRLAGRGLAVSIACFAAIGVAHGQTTVVGTDFSSEALTCSEFSQLRLTGEPAEVQRIGAWLNGVAAGIKFMRYANGGRPTAAIDIEALLAGADAFCRRTPNGSIFWAAVEYSDLDKIR